jgi:hypothetical protein
MLRALKRYCTSVIDSVIARALRLYRVQYYFCHLITYTYKNRALFLLNVIISETSISIIDATIHIISQIIAHTVYHSV